MSDNALMEQRKVDRSIADAIQVGKGGINFQNAGEAMEFARLMSASGSMVPKHLRGQPGACLGVIGTALRFNIDPFALAQKTYFVNDMIAFESAFFMAIINVHAPLKERPDIRFEGEGAERRCIVSGVFLNGGLREYRSPRFADIQPKNSPLWKHDPDQQMAYAGLRAFARRWCPEIIMGMYDVDELRDAAMTDVTPKTEPAAPPRAVPRTLDEFAASGPPSGDPGAGSGAGGALRGDTSSAPASAPPGPAQDFPPSPAAAAVSQVTAGENPAGSNPVPSISQVETQPDPILRTEAIDKVFAAATDKALTLDDRLANLDTLVPVWEERLAGEGEFVNALFKVATSLAKGELKQPAARKYLESVP